VLTPRRTAAGLASVFAGVLLLSGCDVSGASTDDATAALSHTGGAPAGGSAPQEHSEPRFGSQYRFDSGLAVTVSRPTSFQPGTSAQPAAEHAVAFQITVHNKTDHQYRISDMSVNVAADELDAPLLTDPTQGYTGLPSSGTALPTGEKKQVNIAFAIPEDARDLRLTIAPAKNDSASVTYVGSARTSDTHTR